MPIQDLTDKQLEAIAAGKQPPIEALSVAELEALAAGPARQPGIFPFEHPLFGSPTLKEALRTVGGIGLPIAGEVLGGIAAGRLKPLVGLFKAGKKLAGSKALRGLGSAITGGLGGAGGEAASQQLGLTEADRGAILAAGAVGPATRAVLGPITTLAGRIPKRIIPGVKQAQAVEGSLTIEPALKGIRQRALGPEPSSQMYERLATLTKGQTSTPIVPLNATARMLKRFPDLRVPHPVEFEQGLRDIVAPKRMTPLQKRMRLQKGGSLGFTDLRSQIRDVNAAIRETRDTVDRGAFKQLLSGLLDDLDKANVPPELKALYQQAGKQFKRELAFNNIVDRAVKMAKTQPELNIKLINGARFKDAVQTMLRDDSLYQVMTSAERLEIDAFVDSLGKLPVFAWSEGTISMSAMVGGALGTSAGLLLGGPSTAATAGVLGTIAGLSAPNIIKEALHRPVTRRLLVTLAKEGKGVLDKPKLAFLAQAIRTLNQQEEPAPRPAPQGVGPINPVQ